MSVLDVQADEETWNAQAERVQSHYSSIMLHRKCPQAWYFRYGLGLGQPETAGPKPYMHHGIWFGAMRSAEALERGRKMGSLVGKPGKLVVMRKTPTTPEISFDEETVTPKDILQACVDWWKLEATDELYVEEWLKTVGEPAPLRLKNQFVRWRDEYGEAAKNEEPLGVEIFWKRTLPRPKSDAEWHTPDGKPLPDMVLIGFIDELYRDVERDILVVRDNKTQSRMATQTSIDDMLDSQLQFYAWGVTPKLHMLGLPRVRAVAYDRAMSVAPPKPKLNQNGTLSATVKNFDLRTYREWVAAGQEYPGRAKDGSGKGIYALDPEIVKNLSDPAWRAMFHQRTLTPINEKIVQAHLRAAVDTVTDAWRTMQRTAVTYEAARNLSKDNCRWCDYVSLCRAMMFGGPEGQYDLREHGLRGPDPTKPILEYGVFTEDFMGSAANTDGAVLPEFQ